MQIIAVSAFLAPALAVQLNSAAQTAPLPTWPDLNEVLPTIDEIEDGL